MTDGRDKFEDDDFDDKDKGVSESVEEGADTGAEEGAEEAAYVPENPRCGFVALVGAPNAGKSTLLNAMVGSKVSIVSSKVQTTRTRVLGITIAGDSQIIFVDTPGIFKPKRRLDRAMVAAAWQGAEDADLVGLLFDVSRRGIDQDTQGIITRLKEQGRKAILILNKIDLVPREKLLGLADSFNQEGIFTDIFMLSASTGDGVEHLRGFLAARMPEGPWHYPEDQISDMPMRLLAAEITREKLFQQLHQELPYAATVETEQWEEFENGSVKISQVVYVQRDSQKAIVLGKQGTRIKALGQAARTELEEMLEQRVHLMLFVKVREDWENDPERYEAWNLDFGAS
ncbi:GTPase Era [Azospirillum brasilense]|uniref:GTPase Era n=1 Tax=Azospirillum brasilense TaxID=192 RepID=A0A4D8QRT4_AZOBR|nr:MULTISPECIES: GTPase Era [Azospirillum]MDW7552064.1 GTPase Era [Azospirillum brasilense]MDW7591499.1 GTPase Era [Azospirillum brasilense]MDW7626669.1 GTPase Era [Azospirillum brasilense]MDX5950982.1 GTPase Era [Azospirillum brasilense]OPH14673.1 GTPase Era [Azospirillum brasilense]